MSDILDNNLNTESLVINQESKAYLLETAKWGKFLAILGFIMLAFMIVASLAMGAFMGTLMSSMGGGAGGPAAAMGGGAITFMYILIALIYFFPLLYLYRFSTKMKTALISQDQMLLSESLRNLKSCYKFLGIFTLVILILYAIIIVFAVIAGMFASF